MFGINYVSRGDYCGGGFGWILYINPQKSITNNMDNISKLIMSPEEIIMVVVLVEFYTSPPQINYEQEKKEA